MSRFGRTFRAGARVARGIASVAFVAATLGAGAAHAAGSVERGQEKSATCVACHGEAGIATAPQWPNLAGQYTDYLEHALLAYRSGARQNAVMQGFAAQLTDEDIEDLAAYFSAQEVTPLVTAPRNEAD